MQGQYVDVQELVAVSVRIKRHLTSWKDLVSGASWYCISDCEPHCYSNYITNTPSGGTVVQTYSLGLLSIARVAARVVAFRGNKGTDCHCRGGVSVREYPPPSF